MSDRPRAVHLQGDRVSLVPVDVDLHLENYVKWLNDAVVTQWLLRTLPISRLQEREWLESMARGSTDQVVWAVHDEGGRHIGGTGIHNIDWAARNAITGIVIGDRDAWGKGYGREIMALRTTYAFEELGLNRLESECFIENDRSAKCLEATGYRKVGVARQRRWKHGAFRDTFIWDFLATDYFAGAAPSAEQ